MKSWSQGETVNHDGDNDDGDNDDGDDHSNYDDDDDDDNSMSFPSSICFALLLSHLLLLLL